MIGARDLAFVGCRLLSLYVLWFTLAYLAQSVFFVLDALVSPGQVRLGLSSHASANLTFVVTNLAVFVALWFGAARIAGMVAAGTADMPAGQAAGWSRQKVLSLAVVALGLWVLIHELPVLLSYAPLMIPDPSDEFWPDVTVHPSMIVSAVLTSTFGLLCILGTRGIVTFIARLRRW